MKNKLYQEIRDYVKEHNGFSSEFKETELYKKILKIQEGLRQFENKKVKISYLTSVDFFKGYGSKTGRIVFDNNRTLLDFYKIKFYEGLSRTKFYWLDLGLFGGFYATLILKEISEVTKEEFKEYLKEQKVKRERDK